MKEPNEKEIQMVTSILAAVKDHVDGVAHTNDCLFPDRDQDMVYHSCRVALMKYDLHSGKTHGNRN